MRVKSKEPFDEKGYFWRISSKFRRVVPKCKKADQAKERLTGRVDLSS
jgi:hypothetical protein